MGAEELRARLGDAARLAWPRTRRWRRFLRSLPLDPDRLPVPLPAPGERDFIICGSPRSGTSLAAAALYQPPRAIVAMEPWDGMRLPPAELFASLREEIARTGSLRRQRLDVRALREDGAVRWVREGEGTEPVEVEDPYLLGVKWPAFWRYLELLPETRFLVCLRDPVEVVTSFRRSGGYLGRGLNRDVAFNRRMNDELRRETRRFAERRALLYEYVNARIASHLSRPNVLPVRYERWFTDREGLMREVSAFLGVELGPGDVRIRAPEPPDASDEDLELIRRHCRSAEALGYHIPAGAREAAV